MEDGCKGWVKLGTTGTTGVKRAEGPVLAAVSLVVVIGVICPEDSSDSTNDVGLEEGGNTITSDAKSRDGKSDVVVDKPLVTAGGGLKLADGTGAIPDEGAPSALTPSDLGLKNPGTGFDEDGESY